MDKTVGVLGGGQLGRMFAEAANRLNVTVKILDKEDAPAKKILNHPSHISGSFKNSASIRELSKGCDVLTIEIEHVDTTVLKELSSQGVAIEPYPETISIIQDKYLQKEHLKKYEVAVAQSMKIPTGSSKELEMVGEAFGYPFMLKSRREAYDGRGNFPVKSDKQISEAIEALKDRELYAEKWAKFRAELAVMVVQTKDSTLAYPAVETVHENSICKLVYAPARNVSSAILKKAQDLAKKAVASFKGKGVFGVEMFLLEDDTLLINEIAPRPHNSGHYTIEACPVSQYDAHLRAILDLPIPESSLQLREPAIMLNILGGSDPKAHLKIAEKALSVPRTSIHLYAKGDGSKGRKMGHVTVTAPTTREAEAIIQPLIDAVDVISGSKSSSSTSQPPPAAAASQPAGTSKSPQVAVLMGSDSDLPVLHAGFAILEKFNIPYEHRITSAHRTPRWKADYVSSAKARGIKVIIAAAGGAAHLPGMAAAYTPLPVIGVPVKASNLGGEDSLLSIVQMPRGVPVATVAIGNSTNAALLAARIIGVDDERVGKLVEEYAAAAEEEVMAKDAKLHAEGWKAYKWP
ncbi:phosphoribosylaminoimidazole carboxylase [Aulographum hederae CBS 113979]|uniref:Phosphoribosylaminoimidazole carboxylase n=1 Tax=Aulographum hederae CBS 113979 TaxID=1176131 RepID=A0A6G1GU10_9PEZI|nr:phosphoribosylaminoimidazole carboxylase [Aulographum hederae CBS 113979]